MAKIETNFKLEKSLILIIILGILLGVTYSIVFINHEHQMSVRSASEHLDPYIPGDYPRESAIVQYIEKPDGTYYIGWLGYPEELFEK